MLKRPWCSPVCIQILVIRCKCMRMTTQLRARKQSSTDTCHQSWKVTCHKDWGWGWYLAAPTAHTSVDATENERKACGTKAITMWIEDECLEMSIKCNRVAPSIRVAPAFILVHFFSEGPLKRRNSLNTHISRNYEVFNEQQWHFVSLSQGGDLVKKSEPK